MTKSLVIAAKVTCEYLQSISDDLYRSGGVSAVERLERVIQELSLAIDEPVPCQCVDLERCNMYDRCCKYD